MAGSDVREIRYLCREARDAFEAFSIFSKAKKVPLKQKEMVFKTLIITVQLYALGTRFLSIAELNMLGDNLALFGEEASRGSGIWLRGR